MQIDHRSSRTRQRWTAARDPRDLLAHFADDPWALSLAERRELAHAANTSQERWLKRLRQLVEPPLPEGDFPAFLLDLPPFSRLHREVGDARRPGELATAVADELQRFADHYRDYLSAVGDPQPDLERS